jgi:hypothetical protein
MYLKDSHGDRRRKIGDKVLEIDLLVKKPKKFKRTFQPGFHRGQLATNIGP